MKSKKVSKKKLREFGFLIAIFCPLMFGFILPLLHSSSFQKWTIYISLPSLLLAIFDPYKLKIFYIFWMKLGDILGFINGNLILGIVHILVLLPISVILKIFKYDPLKGIDKTLNSYKNYKSKSNVNYEKIF